MEKDLVSIIIPVYNAEKYLPTCLESIINQTYKNIEIICVNDGSVDTSDEILNDFSKQDSRIKVIQQTNKGASEARNTAIDAASGEFLMFVDADDFITLDACEIAVTTAQQNNADLVFWSYLRDFGDHTKEKHFFWEDGKIFETEEVKSQLHRRLCGLLNEEIAHPDYLNSFEPIWNKLYRLDYIKNNNIRFVDIKKISTSEDGIFNLYVFEYVKRAVYIKKCLYKYTKTNDGSLTSKYKPNLFSQWQNLFELIKTYIDEHNLSNDYYDALDNRIALSLIGLGLNIVNSDSSLIKNVNLISQILNSPIYIRAYQKLKYKYLPLHWRIFFLFAKFKFSFGVFMMLKVIKYLKNH